MKFINLTPHAIRIGNGDCVITVVASGELARVSTSEQVVSKCPVSGVDIVTRVVGDVIGLPAPQDGVFYLVSGMVLDAVVGRNDVFAPDTGSTAVRNEKGHIDFVTRLVQSK